MQRQLFNSVALACGVCAMLIVASAQALRIENRIQAEIRASGQSDIDASLNDFSRSERFD